ncbi:hypothetical protein MR810_02465 [bacterium]|nr:hypothetical protein [bacterium]
MDVGEEIGRFACIVFIRRRNRMEARKIKTDTCMENEQQRLDMSGKTKAASPTAQGKWGNTAKICEDAI